RHCALQSLRATSHTRSAPCATRLSMTDVLKRVSCDSVVALKPLTGSATIFAKNSDRPAGECQPLIQLAAADHRKGSELACQYVSIEQVEHTHAFIGSRPHWLWGLEHGVNEHG